jgi:hypothetical protein
MEESVQDLARLTDVRPFLAEFEDGQDDQETSNPNTRVVTDQLVGREVSTGGMLSHAESLIRDSGAARATLQDLLSRFLVDADSAQ